MCLRDFRETQLDSKSGIIRGVKITQKGLFKEIKLSLFFEIRKISWESEHYYRSSMILLLNAYTLRISLSSQALTGKYSICSRHRDSKHSSARASSHQERFQWDERFHVLTIVNKAAMNGEVHVSFQVSVLISFR